MNADHCKNKCQASRFSKTFENWRAMTCNSLPMFDYMSNVYPSIVVKKTVERILHIKFTNTTHTTNINIHNNFIRLALISEANQNEYFQRKIVSTYLHKWVDDVDHKFLRDHLKLTKHSLNLMRLVYEIFDWIETKILLLAEINEPSQFLLLFISSINQLTLCSVDSFMMLCFLSLSSSFFAFFCTND